MCTIYSNIATCLLVRLFAQNNECSTERDSSDMIEYDKCVPTYRPNCEPTISA